MQANSYSKMGKFNVTIVEKDDSYSFCCFLIVHGHLQVILTFLVAGVVFIPLGVICLFASQGVCASCYCFSAFSNGLFSSFGFVVLLRICFIHT